jgi:hypothetical protein
VEFAAVDSAMRVDVMPPFKEPGRELIGQPVKLGADASSDSRCPEDRKKAGAIA